MIIIAISIGIVVIMADSSINSPKKADNEANNSGKAEKTALIILGTILAVIIIIFLCFLRAMYELGEMCDSCCDIAHSIGDMG